MTMVESAPDPLEPIFRNFEKIRGWKLSPQARMILTQGVISVGTDTLGLGVLGHGDLRLVAQVRVVELMPQFLELLAKKALERDQLEKQEKTIGGIFVLQNIGQWKDLFGCTCWPV
jgi:hypothetical protein